MKKIDMMKEENPKKLKRGRKKNLRIPTLNNNGKSLNEINILGGGYPPAINLNFDSIKKDAIDLYKANALEEVEKALKDMDKPNMSYDWESCAYTELKNLKTIKKYLLFGVDMKPSKEKEKEIELKLEKLRQYENAYENRKEGVWCPKCTPLCPRDSFIGIVENTGGLWHSNEQCSVIKAIYNKKWWQFW